MMERSYFFPSEFGFCPHPRGSVSFSNCEPLTPAGGWGLQRTPALSSSLGGPGGSSPLAAERDGAGHGAPVQRGPAQSSPAPRRPRRISGSGTAQASEGAAASGGGDPRPAGNGRGLGRRLNFSGTRGSSQSRVLSSCPFQSSLSLCAWAGHMAGVSQPHSVRTRKLTCNLQGAPLSG